MERTCPSKKHDNLSKNPSSTSKKQEKLDFFFKNRNTCSLKQLKKRDHSEDESLETVEKKKIKNDPNETSFNKLDLKFVENQTESVIKNSIIKTEKKSETHKRENVSAVFDELSATSDSISDAQFKQTNTDDSYDEDFLNLLRSDIDCLTNELFNYRFKALMIDEQFDENLKKCITIKAERASDKNQTTFVLQDEWSENSITEGDIFNVLSTNGQGIINTEDKVIIDSKNNLLVLHPDNILSTTVVSTSLICPRKALLNTHFKNTEIFGHKTSNSCILVGTLVHKLFQKSLVGKKVYSEKELYTFAYDLVEDPQILTDMLVYNITKKKLLEEISIYIPRICSWLKSHLVESNSLNSKDTEIDFSAPNEDDKFVRFKADLHLQDVADIEESFFSPCLAMKGKIDVSGRFRIRNKQTGHTQSSLLPIEVKTGKFMVQMPHRIQVLIYSLFCSERSRALHEDSPLPLGLLLYLKSEKMSCVPLKDVDRRGVLQIRNKMAHYIKKIFCNQDQDEDFQVNYPETISNYRVCKSCDQSRNCALMSKITTDQSTTPDLKDLFGSYNQHLNDADIKYFRHWVSCVFLEYEEKMKRSKDSNSLWLKTSRQRYEDGTCLADLKLAAPPKVLENSWRFEYTFKHHSTEDPNKIFHVDELVLLGLQEPPLYSISHAIVRKIHKNFITVDVERDLKRFDDGPFTLDKFVWSSSNILQTSLSNLSILMTSHQQCDRLRHLIIRHNEPTFMANLSSIPHSSKDKVAEMLRGLNRTQRQAIKRVLLSNDYTLVVGMPGSGKTTTIVAMIRILLLCGLRVLVTSYTHSAVDNLLMKLIKYKVDFLRLGKSSQIHPLVLPYSESELSKNFKSPEDFLELYNKSLVVGCTCLAATSNTFFFANEADDNSNQNPRFDVCIVDEASQISQPACIAPLMHAKKFVLVGDHKQLPPLVISKKAKELEADESLFWRLTGHTQALCQLTMQYRMNKCIMDLSNYLTYEDKLECAHPTVAIASAKLPHFDEVCKQLRSKTDVASYDWLIETLNPKTSVKFFDSFNIESEEGEEGKVQNTNEAVLITLITLYLIKCGLATKDIGIISPFRKQLKIIKDKLEEFDACKDVEVNTIDKYQGRDKSVILLSFVVNSNKDDQKHDGKLLSDWRRLNVAMTRSKHKLLMVGSKKTLQRFAPCKKLMRYLEDNSMICQAPDRSHIDQLFTVSSVF